MALHDDFLILQEKVNLENTIESMKEDNKAQIKEFMNQIENNAKRNKERFESLTAAHTEDLERLRAEHGQLLQTRMDQIQQEHKLQVDALTKEYEENLSSSNSDIDSMFQSQLEAVKASHQKTIEEQSEQLEAFRKQVSELSQKNVELGKDITEKTQYYEAQSTEMENRLKEQVETNEKLLKEKENLQISFKEQQQSLEQRIKDMTNQIDSLNQKLEQITSENVTLKQTLDEQKNEINSKNDALEKKDGELSELTQRVESEKAQLCSEIEMKQTELGQKVDQYECRLTDERANHEQEMVRRLEAVTLQQEASVDEVSAELSKQLTAANERIAAHDLLIQELKMKDSDLSNKLENSQKEYETKLGSLTGEKDNLEKKLESLVEREKLLKTENQKLQTEYESTSASQGTALTEMKERVEQLSRAEGELREQLKATLDDCDAKLASATENYTAEVTGLAETLTGNQHQLQSVLQELEAARAETSDISNRFTAELNKKSAELDDAQDKIRHGEEEVEKTRREFEDRVEEVRKEVQERNEQLKKVAGELQEKLSAADGAAQRVNELEQNLSTWQAAAKDNQGANSDLLRKISELETTTQQQREALQEKIAFLEKQVSLFICFRNVSYYWYSLLCTAKEVL